MKSNYLTAKKNISNFMIMFLSMFFLMSCQQADKKSDASKSDSPNVIFMMVDDMGFGDLSMYGQTEFETPNLDKFAQDGMVLGEITSL